MKKILLACLILQFSLNLWAQSDTIIYYKGFQTEVERDSAIWYRKIHMTDLTRLHYTAIDMYANGKMKRSEGPYTAYKQDWGNMYPNGNFSNYDSMGRKTTEGNYVTDADEKIWGKQRGKWLEYYENGNAEWEYNYEAIEKKEYSNEQVISYWDSTGKKLLSNGNGPLTFPGKDGPGDDTATDVTISCIYKNGRLDGKSTIVFTKTGKLFAEEQFADGALVKGTSYNKAGNKFNYTKLEVNPEYVGGDVALIKFLQRNIKYPSYERNNDIMGKVLLRFIVDKEGHVGNVRIIRHVSPGLDAEAMRVVEQLPDFSPGARKGQPVRVYFNLPVVFKLQ